MAKYTVEFVMEHLFDDNVKYIFSVVNTKMYDCHHIANAWMFLLSSKCFSRRSEVLQQKEKRHDDAVQCPTSLYQLFETPRWEDRAVFVFATVLNYCICKTFLKVA